MPVIRWVILALILDWWEISFTQHQRALRPVVRIRWRHRYHGVNRWNCTLWLYSQPRERQQNVEHWSFMHSKWRTTWRPPGTISIHMSAYNVPPTALQKKRDRQFWAFRRNGMYCVRRPVCDCNTHWPGTNDHRKLVGTLTDCSPKWWWPVIIGTPSVTIYAVRVEAQQFIRCEARCWLASYDHVIYLREPTASPESRLGSK